MKAVHLSLRSTVLAILALVVLIALSTQVVAQSLTTGAIAGVVTDSTGGVVPNAAVDLKSTDTGGTQSTKSGQSGEYRFTLLKPGNYSVTVTLSGFQKSETPVQVAVGQVVTTNVQLEVGQTTQTVEVTESAPLINPDPSMNTPFTPQELQELPSAGGDITNIVGTVAGVTLNVIGASAAGGNFTANGLPGTSNLFTVNGENDMDPYFNINNSGAANLTIGQNEIQEASVITNPYSGQYGQLAGAQVSYVTKSGTNEFHGNAQYWWNGRAVNANDFFNNYYGTPRPFSNDNQWATSVGGPIRKNKTFFFVDTEGMRFVLPANATVTVPTQPFASAVLANVKARQPAEYPTYQSMMNLWASAPGAATAQNLPNTSQCNALTGASAIPGFNPATQACAARFTVAPTALGSEWILAGRVDQKLTDRDNLYFRYKADHGLQPTSIDPINAAFDALSSQPSWDSQAHETHIFSPTMTNDFSATLSHYVAQFTQNHQLEVSTFPWAVETSTTVPFTGVNSLGYDFPQGRNATQYQFIDDAAKIHGAHTFKFGVNFRRYDVSDHNFIFNFPTVYFGYTAAGLTNFANGIAYQYRERDNFASDVPIAMWGMGLYAQDEWRATRNLKLTLAFRTEKNSNPVCQFNCFANLSGPWNTLPSVNSANPGNVPYSSDIKSGQHQAFPGTDALNLSPRIGFSWSPGQSDKTVVSGGIGVFYDNPAVQLVDDLTANPPVVTDIRVRPAAGVLAFDPGPSGGAAIWQASANAFSLSKTYTQISTAMKTLGAVFNAPAVIGINGTIHSPQWQEWNLQVQRQLTPSSALVVNYVGNHGIHIIYGNNWSNAYDEYGIFPNVPGIHAAAPVANYGQVGQIQSGAVSNYNGLSISLKKQFTHWFSAHLNYTWAHNLDEDSNGGVTGYGDSTLTQINPLSLRANNYGNSDYDIRNQFSADWVVTPRFRSENKVLSHLLGGWTLAGKWFWRSGLPFSIVDGNWNGALGNGGSTIFATPNGGQVVNSGGCGAAAVDTSCLNANAFLNSGAASFNNFTAWSPQTRNQFHGPHFFDIDMNLFRNFRLREKKVLSIGAQAFNLLNHPNFANPDNGLGDSTFGQVLSTVGNPTSPYGTGLGFDSSPRSVQLTGKFVF